MFWFWLRLCDVRNRVSYRNTTCLKLGQQVSCSFLQFLQQFPVQLLVFSWETVRDSREACSFSEKKVVKQVQSLISLAVNQRPRIEMSLCVTKILFVKNLFYPCLYYAISEIKFKTMEILVKKFLSCKIYELGELKWKSKDPCVSPSCAWSPRYF